MGMEHKLEAYAAVLHLPLHAGTIVLDLATIVLTLVEFTLGIYLLLGMRRRITRTGTLLVMGVMTAVTTYLYITNPISDCGCFGDAVTLTHGETLTKNLVLLGLVLILMHHPQRMLRLISKHNQWLLSYFSIVYLLGVTLYSLHYLPLVDFTGYALGTDVRKALAGQYTTTFTYQRNGVQREFDEAHLPDSTWQYVSMTTTETVAPTIKEFSFTDGQGEDISEAVLADTGFVFIVTLPYLPEADAGCSDALNDVYDYATDHGHRFLCATTGTGPQVSDWVDRTGAAYPFVWGSAEMLKAMVRSNPGLILMKNGRIIAKWGHNDLPDDQTLHHLDTAVEEVQRHRSTRAFEWLALWFVLPFGVLLLLDRLWMGHRYYKVFHYYKSQKQRLQ